MVAKVSLGRSYQYDAKIIVFILCLIFIKKIEGVCPVAAVAALWHTPSRVVLSGRTILLNRANSEPVEPVVVVLRVDTSRVEGQVPRIPGGVERSRPVVAARAAIVPRLPIAVARASKKELITINLTL